MSSKLKLIRQSISEKEKAFNFEREVMEERKKNQQLQLQIKQLELENVDLHKRISEMSAQIKQLGSEELTTELEVLRTF